MRSMQDRDLVCESEGACADCGRLSAWRVRCFDPHTYSNLELCGNCAPAFRERRQHSVGCCN